jgi:quinol monooxygenase YgiN
LNDSRESHKSVPSRRHRIEREIAMVTVGLFVPLEAKPGKEDDVEAFLLSGLPLVQDEPDTIAWFAVRFGPTSFGIFDVFPDDSGRQAHLSGKVAEALMAQAPDLFAQAPDIQKLDVLASKLPE